MAYSAAITRTGSFQRGLHIAIAETEGAIASEATIPNVPIRGRIVALGTEKVSGDATSHDPIVATAAAGSGPEIRAGDCGPTTGLNLTGSYPYYAPTGTLYYRTRPNTGSNNAMTVEIMIVERLI